jgi:hypothetical protein
MGLPDPAWLPPCPSIDPEEDINGRAWGWAWDPTGGVGVPLASVSVAALKRDTNARTVRSNLVVDTPFPGLARSNAWKRAKLGPRGTYRYVNPP